MNEIELTKFFILQNNVKLQKRNLLSKEDIEFCRITSSFLIDEVRGAYFLCQ